MVQNNAYADDVNKISRNLKAMEEALQELGNRAQAIGLIINQEKTKYISK
jgi:prefoldin subunit 5